MLFKKSRTKVSENQVVSQIMGAFGEVFGIGAAGLNPDFRKLFEASIRRNYPDFRRSVARCLFEGDSDGLPVPIDTVPASKQRRHERRLLMLDALATFLVNQQQLRGSKKHGLGEEKKPKPEAVETSKGKTLVA